MTEHELAQILYGDGVRLRPWTRRDALEQERWPPYGDPFHSLWNIPRYYSLDNFLPSWSAQRYVWAVDDTQRHLIGRISLREIDLAQGHARLGITLGAPYTSRGLGTEALRVFLDHYFGPLDFRLMKLDVAAFNLRAVRCYERLGFHHIGEDWRSAGSDPVLRLLDEPQHALLRQYFRRNRHEYQVLFYEMELGRVTWLGK